MIFPLLLASTKIGLEVLKVGGVFILKIFDIFTKTTCDIMYLLSSLYKQVYIVKPNTSRLANSEKYIVCKGFRRHPDKLVENIIANYNKLKQTKYISSIFNFNIDYFFTNKIEEYNAIFGQQQIENINNTLSFISCKNNGEKLESLKRNNVQKCIRWCEIHNIERNETLTPVNIFIT